jgi:hypothetical protein
MYISPKIYQIMWHAFVLLVVLFILVLSFQVQSVCANLAHKISKMLLS